MPSVSVEPGAMPLTRMPCGPSSRAIARVRLTTPALAATKAHWSRKGTRPAIDAMLMIRPPPAAASRWAAARLTSYRPVRSTARIRSHSDARELVDRHPVGQAVDAGVVDQDVERAPFPTTSSITPSICSAP